MVTIPEIDGELGFDLGNGAAFFLIVIRVGIMDPVCVELN